FVKETRPTVYAVVGDRTIDKKYIIDDYDIVIFKNEFNVFTGNKFTNDILKILLPNTVVVYGVATDVCVDFAVKGLLKKGITVIVIEDCIKGLSEDSCKIALENWVKNGVILTNILDLEKLVCIKNKS
ncbi:hypothetical protein LCGC14_2393410, partial [marine sediment metagenome]